MSAALKSFLFLNMIASRMCTSFLRLNPGSMYRTCCSAFVALIKWRFSGVLIGNKHKIRTVGSQKIHNWERLSIYNTLYHTDNSWKYDVRPWSWEQGLGLTTEKRWSESRRGPVHRGKLHFSNVRDEELYIPGTQT